MKKHLHIPLLLLMLASCSEDKSVFPTLTQDVCIGWRIDSAITANPAQFNVLERSKYAAIYSYTEEILQQLLESDGVRNAEAFSWQIRVINDKSVISAFVAPGGYFYLYTGILMALDNEAQLAGLLAHQLAHIDCRHITKMLLRHYDLSTFESIAAGLEQAALDSIIHGLVNGSSTLKYSCSNEHEADSKAMEYLFDTGYDPYELINMYRKLLTCSVVAQFFAIHPWDDGRIENLEAAWKNLGARHGENYTERYLDFKKSLP